MSNPIDIIDEHIIIRETIGYDGIKDVNLVDLPEVLKFLKIVHNYKKIKKLSYCTIIWNTSSAYKIAEKTILT